MDFIVGFLKAGKKSVLMVVVDRLSKYVHLCALQHQFTLAMVSQLFIDTIFKLHGMPTYIVYDRDPTFTSTFWQELFKRRGTQLKMRTFYHPQTKGQTEAVNKCLETYLCSFALENNTNGSNGFLWLNGGTTQHIMKPLKWLPMKLFMGNNLLSSLLVFQALPRFRQWRLFFKIGTRHWQLSRIIFPWIKIA